MAENEARLSNASNVLSGVGRRSCRGRGFSRSLWRALLPGEFSNLVLYFVLEVVECRRTGPWKECQYTNSIEKHMSGCKRTASAILLFQFGELVDLAVCFLDGSIECRRTDQLVGVSD
jgi:hypothetical protein